MEKLRVLVCDDEPGMRMVILRALRGYTVSLPEFDGEVAFDCTDADTGERALEVIEEQKPDLLLLDLKLPGISGLDVLDAVAGQKLSMLTVMITAHASIETAVRATKQGAYDFLPKPFTPAELKSTVAKAARHWVIERQARKLAEEKRRVRFEFISVLAHELKAPINAVDGYMNILLSGTAGDNPEVLRQMIERCSLRIAGMRKMIGDLLDLTRIESGQKRRELKTVDVNEVARTAIETALPDAQARNIAIELHDSPDLTIEGDPGEIEIVFNNLITNAVKYNKDGGRVDVHVSRKDDALVVRVKDTGIGMTEDEQAMLFQDFTRIKNKETMGILGSGLGLSILKKLTHLYHGDLHVESERGVGSTFTVRLRHTEVEDIAIPVEEPLATLLKQK